MMKHVQILLLVAVAAAAVAPFAVARSVNGEAKNDDVIIRDLAPIDATGKYHVQWEINVVTKRATFLVVVETLGYVGFGFSRGGGMTGADIAIGGVHDDGRIYFSDRHGVGNMEPVVDARQDYHVTRVYENMTHTHLQFYRLLDTCDDQDVPITTDTISIIWAYGASDNVEYHIANRGTYSANLLDPRPPFEEDGLDTWTLTANSTMPAQPTTYWCSMYKTPAHYTSKRHVVAFDTVLPTAESLKHTHHLTMYRCKAPAGVDPDTIFGPLVGLDGGECHVPPEDQVIPIDLCRDIIYVWAVGGNLMSLPENVGYPINENGQAEYMMLEIHYDNPEVVEGVRFESHIQVYNTPELREHEAALAVLAHSITFSHIVPGLTRSYTTVGHCSSQCTSSVLPPDGINVFNVLLHAHKAGRQLRLRHFRGRTELPWLTSDDHYDFDFQQNRPLREHVKVMPGDHLTTECGQGTLDRDHVTMSGLGTTEEMCQSLIFYYPAGELKFCESAYNEAKIMEQFGIEDIAWDNILLPPIVLAPESMANKTYLEVLNTMVPWTPQYIADLEQETRYTNHYQASCGVDPFGSEKAKRDNWKKAKQHAADYPVGYPDLDSVYVPEDPCTKA